MGNQITCPSGASSYTDYLESVDMKIQRSLVAGTFILSFLAVDKNGRPSVVKVIRLTDPQSHNMALHYLKLFEQLRKRLRGYLSRNIIVEPVVTRSGAYMVRGHVEMSLSERIEIAPPLSLIEKNWIAFQILRSIESLHRNDFWHGNIKPKNVLITSRCFVHLRTRRRSNPSSLGGTSRITSSTSSRTVVVGFMSLLSASSSRSPPVRRSIISRRTCSPPVASSRTCSVAGSRYST
jgi:serine/threonine protein kinase